MNRESTITLLSGLSKNRSIPTPLILIAGPCQLESEEHSLMLACEIKSVTDSLGVPFIFKGSFDKANRTSISGQRGLGLEPSIKIFSRIKTELNIPTITDVHSPDQVEMIASIVDLIQIPAFLCRQTDLLIAAGRSGLPIMIKKGQFLHPKDMKHAAEKVLSTGNRNILLCERGSCFGYRDLVVDMRSLYDMRELGYPVVFDGTHSVQSMGGNDGSSGGSRKYIPSLCRAAVAAGVDAIFLEIHQDPKSAPSDSESMLPLEELRPLLTTLNSIHNLVKG